MDIKTAGELRQESEDAQFDTLMNNIGTDGYFQKRFNVLFNLVLVALMSLSYLNLLMALSVPIHHCNVPGRNASEYTMDEWRARMLPREINPETDEMEPSSCNMFKTDYYGNPLNETQPCMHGWEYDDTWFKLTASSQQNWVCDDEIYVANAYAAGRIGEILGVIIFGQLGDSIGRKPVYFISTFLLVIGRALTAVTAGYYEWFVVLTGISSVASTVIFQTPLLIGMEVTGEKGRANLAFTQCVGWTVGICMLPLVAWIVGDWRIMLLVTTLPSALAFAVYRLMPESPRWLASAGNVQGALRVLDYIAKVNSHKLPDNAEQVIKAMAKKKEKTYGALSMFANKRLAINSVLLLICWTVSGLTYVCLILNATNMAGNPFLNFFLQSLVELPGYVVAKYLCDKVGRRWTSTGSYAVAAVFTAITIACQGHSTWLVTVLVCFIKMSQTITYYTVLLQSMEIYPTCVRQTGTSMGTLAVNLIGILAPYIIYWGETVDVRVPYAILFVIGLIGTVTSAILPETLNKRLPETLEDSKTFGMEQKFWSFNKEVETTH